MTFTPFRSLFQHDRYQLTNR